MRATEQCAPCSRYENHDEGQGCCTIGVYLCLLQRICGLRERCGIFHLGLPWDQDACRYTRVDTSAYDLTRALGQESDILHTSID